MEMMNRAIEGAADFGEFKRRLMADAQDQRALIDQLRQKCNAPEDAPTLPRGQKRPGENREQFRARLRAERKAGA